MATVAKDFKIKNGLIVEGSTGTINNYDILTKSSADQNYITSLVGGSSTSDATANTIVKRDANASFAANVITADLVGDVSGDVTGTVSDISNHDTGDLTEGTNLYFTNARAEAAVGNLDTDDLSEGTTNLYFTNARAQAAVAGDITSAIDALDTDDIEEGASNLYYTDTRARGAISAGTGISYASGNGVVSVDTTTIASQSYVDNAITALVDGAPGLLDTLNELAAAINDDESFATTITTSIGEKVSKSGDTMTGDLNFGDAWKVTNLAAPTVSDDAATKQYADDVYSNATSYADGLAGNYDPAGSAANAQSAAESYADSAIAALDTDDIEEGASNLYHTAQRSVDAVATAISGGTQTNITVSYNNGTGKFDFVAENGVADSDTDDLAEGTSNLYFTNARAVAALEAVTPDFPSVEIASVAKQVAAEASVPTASTNTAVSWAKAEYRSAEFLVKIANGSHTEISKVILTLDTSDNVAITEYAMVGTNGSLGSVSADVNGADVRLRVTTDNNSSTVGVIGTLLK
jgi:hypothetical protein